MNRCLLSSQKTDWCTPQNIFDQLDSEFHFVLDAAATDKSAKCKRYYTPQEDALSRSWDVNRAVFCNPPYGRGLKEWVKKAYSEAVLSGQTIVMLLPARTDTSFFHNYIYGKAEIRFIRGRLKFTDEDGREADSSPFPSMVVVYNP